MGSSWDGTGQGIRKVVRILGGMLTVSRPVSPSVPPVSSVAESEPSSARPVPSLGFDGPRLARAAHLAAHPTSPAPAHGVIGPCSIPRLVI